MNAAARANSPRSTDGSAAPTAAAAPAGSARSAGSHGPTTARQRPGAASRDRDPAAHLERDAAERVLRRAVRLGEDDDSAGVRGVAVDALVEAAEELGIDPADVLRAVAEERLGLLDTGATRGDRVLGPAVVVASRLVDAPVDAALERADAWLRREALRRTRTQAGWADYRRRSDPWAAVQRTARSVQGDRQLEQVQRVRVVASGVGAGRTLLALVVDLHAGRRATAAGASATASAGAVSIAANVLTWPAWMWLTVPAAAAGTVGLLAARRTHVAGIDEELESLLDRMAAGPPPATRRLESLRRR